MAPHVRSHRAPCSCFPKRCPFSCRLVMSGLRSWTGREFHRRVPAAAKVLSISDVRIKQLDWKRVPQARSRGCKSSVAVTADRVQCTCVDCWGLGNRKVTNLLHCVTTQPTITCRRLTWTCETIIGRRRHSLIAHVLDISTSLSTCDTHTHMRTRSYRFIYSCSSSTYIYNAYLGATFCVNLQATHHFTSTDDRPMMQKLLGGWILLRMLFRKKITLWPQSRTNNGWCSLCISLLT